MKLESKRKRRLFSTIMTTTMTTTTTATTYDGERLIDSSSCYYFSIIRTRRLYRYSTSNINSTSHHLRRILRITLILLLHQITSSTCLILQLKSSSRHSYYYSPNTIATYHPKQTTSSFHRRCYSRLEASSSHGTYKQLLSSSVLSLATASSSSGEEKSTTSTNGSSNDYYTKLEEWLISKGGQCDGVTISTTRITPINEDDEHDDDDDDDDDDCDNDNDVAVVHDDSTSRRRQYVRGLVAARDVIDGDILLTVPLETCLSTFHHHGENCSSTEEKNDAGLAQAQAPAWTASLPKKIQLAIRVIIEWSRRTTTTTTTTTNDDDDNGTSQSNLSSLSSSQSSSSSCWAPFLNSWPELVPNLPENLDEKDLVRYAQCETFIADTREYNTWLEQQYTTTSELWQSRDPQSSSTTSQEQSSITNNNFCSMEMFQKAVQLVSSRSVRLSSKRSVCVPILDMANHCSMPSARYVLHNQQDDDDANNTNNSSNSNNTDDDATTTIQLVATRAIKAGDEVTISYGKHTNRQMAGCYGFIPTTPTSNPHDYELISLLEILYAAIDGGVLTIDDGAEIEGAAGKGESGDHLLFSVVNQVAEFGVPITNLRLLPLGRLDSNLWLALRIAMAILRRFDNKTDGNSNNNNNNDNDDDINTIAYILDTIEMDEADEDDLWESDINVEAVIKRATVLHGALIILEQRMGRGGSSSSTTLEEDERNLQDFPILRSGNDSTRLLVELRLERKKLVRSLSNQMKVVLAEEPDGLLRAVSTLISE